MFDLTGKIAMVTGAGQSVGAGIARALAAQGASVWVNDIVADRAHQVASEIDASGAGASASPFDVTDLAAVQEAVRGIGPIDIVVNNAGNAGAESMRPMKFAQMSPDDWEAAIRVNLYGVLNTTHAVLNTMIERSWGRLITISSGAGSTGVPIGVSPYAAAKGGSQAFMRTMAAENARAGITANSVALGLMDNTSGGDVTTDLARGIPTGRLGTPADIAAMCVYVASEEASWVTGQTLHINGGSLMT